MREVYRFGRETKPGEVIFDEQAALPIENSADTVIDPATEQTLLDLAAALDSNGNDALRFLADANVPVEIEADATSNDVAVTSLPEPVTVAQNGAVDVTDDQAREVGKVRAQDSGGVLIDPAERQQFEPVSASDSAATGDGGLTVAIQSEGRPNVGAHWDVPDGTVVELEVSIDGSTWRPFASYDTSTSDWDAIDATSETGVGWAHVRAVVNDDVDATLEVSASR